MKKIIFEEPKLDVINIYDIDEYQPIFAKKDGRLVGMLVKEKEGWIVRTGGDLGSAGHWPTIEECIEVSKEFGCTFHVED